MFTGQYVLSQADIDSLAIDPLVDNVAQATGSGPNGDPVDSNQDPAEIPFVTEAALRLLKDGVYTDVGGDGLTPGDTLDYTFTVTNDGNVSITGVSINEIAFDLPGPIVITAPADVDLSPGESAVFTGQYVLSQADIDSLAIDPLVDNVAQATGSDPNGDPVDSNEDPAEIPFVTEAALRLLKDGVYTDVGGDGLTPGDTLDYTFTVTNDGNVSITGVSINEIAFDLPGPIVITAPADVDLSPGESAVFTGQYVLSQADIDSLAIDPLVDNVAQATGSDPNGDPVDSNQDPAEIPFVTEAALSLLKDGVYTDVGGDGLTPGDTLDYTFTVTNDGNVSITGVSINEIAFDLPGPIVITPPADVDLSPGESAVFTGQYVLSQADIDSLAIDPLVDNVAQATRIRSQRRSGRQQRGPGGDPLRHRGGAAPAQGRRLHRCRRRRAHPRRHARLHLHGHQ